jgi:hypothetical protein
MYCIILEVCNAKDLHKNRGLLIKNGKSSNNEDDLSTNEDDSSTNEDDSSTNFHSLLCLNNPLLCCMRSVSHVKKYCNYASNYHVTLYINAKPTTSGITSIGTVLSSHFEYEITDGQIYNTLWA